MRTAPLPLLLALGAPLACAPSALPCPAPATAAATNPPGATASAAPRAAAASLPDADIALTLRPTPGATPLVHVELSLPRAAWPTARRGRGLIVRGKPEGIVHATARDAGGQVAVTVAAAAGSTGVELRPGRAQSPARSRSRTTCSRGTTRRTIRSASTSWTIAFAARASASSRFPRA